MCFLSRLHPRLSQSQAWCLKTQTMHVVPPVDFFAGGFTCTSVSSNNVQSRGKRLQPCQTGEGDTGRVRGNGECEPNLSPCQTACVMLFLSHKLPFITQVRHHCGRLPRPRAISASLCDIRCSLVSRLCCSTFFVPSLAQAWLATEAYIAKARPRVVLLENLTALMTEYEPGDTSDSDYIVKKLSSFGYQARVPCLGFVSAGCVDPGFVRICVSSS